MNVEEIKEKIQEKIDEGLSENAKKEEEEDKLVFFLINYASHGKSCGKRFFLFDSCFFYIFVVCCFNFLYWFWSLGFQVSF